MYCSEVQLVKHGNGFVDVKPLPCNRWSCDYCAPKRKFRLMAIAAAGEPTTFMTLTVNVNVGASPLNRRNLLHDAFKRLVKRILRQFALPPNKRWSLATQRRSIRKQRIISAITEKTAQAAITRLPYMAFLEKTRIGEPHLHILLRVPFIPQDWLSEQMSDMLGSPIVDIRKVRSSRGAVAYVTKYVAKAPAQFGNTKRYWISRGWEVNTPVAYERNKHERGPVSVKRIRHSEWQDEIIIGGMVVTLLSDGWLRVYPRRTPWEQWGSTREPADA